MPCWTLASTAWRSRATSASLMWRMGIGSIMARWGSGGWWAAARPTRTVNAMGDLASTKPRGDFKCINIGGWSPGWLGKLFQLGASATVQIASLAFQSLREGDNFSAPDRTIHAGARLRARQGVSPLHE